MMHEKIILQNKRSGRYVCGIRNGRLVTTPHLGEAWLMFYGEWWAFTRLHSVADRYKKIEIVVRGVR